VAPGGETVKAIERQTLHAPRRLALPLLFRRAWKPDSKRRADGPGRKILPAGTSSTRSSGGRTACWTRRLSRRRARGWVNGAAPATASRS